jgi:hypothetical protein
MNIHLILASKQARQRTEACTLRNSRLGELDDKINLLAKRIDPGLQYLQLSASLNKSIVAVPSARTSIIHIPYLFLIKTEDLPAQLRLNGWDDPRLESDEYLEQAARWTKRFLGLEREKLDLMKKEALKIFLKFINDPELSEKAKEFILNHEIAHIFYDHRSYANIQSNIRHSLRSKKTLTAMGLIILTSLCLFARTSLSPYLILPSRTTIFVSLLAMQVISQIRLSHKEERGADLLAAKISKDIAQGGAYLFKVFKEHQKKARHRHPFLRLVYSPSGNNRALYFTHPSEKERLHYLTQLASQ